MHKIAILRTKDHYYDYGDWTVVIEKITDFEEVDDETYKILVSGQIEFDYKIIELEVNQSQFIIDTVAKIADRIKKNEESKARKKAEEAAKRQERLLKKKAKDEAAEKELLSTLIKKHGVPSEN